MHVQKAICVTYDNTAKVTRVIARQKIEIEQPM